MKKITLLSAIATAISLTSAVAKAEGVPEMEKCKVVKNGVGLIKAGNADCATGNNTCAGANIAGDPEAWISVPKGQCEKINAGDLSGVSKETKDKINGDKLLKK